jgi:hypothetical protein
MEYDAEFLRGGGKLRIFRKIVTLLFSGSEDMRKSHSFCTA